MALAEVFGADMFLAEMSINAIIHKKEFIKIDYLKDLGKLPAQDVRECKRIARWLLAGSTSLNGWDFAVGATIIGLLKEPVGSGYFEKLHTWVQMWTQKGEQFKRLTK